MEEDIKILENYIEQVWKPKPIHNVIPDWATIEKREIQAIENLIARYKEVEEDLQNNEDYIKELQKKLTNAIEIKYIKITFQNQK